MPSEGTVRDWDDGEGTGVLDSADTPGGCWVHFSRIVTGGLGRLTPGDRVSFTYQAVPQDGYDYRAILVWPPGVTPGAARPPSADQGPSAAYRSSLTIRWSDGTVTKDGPGPGQRT